MTDMRDLMKIVDDCFPEDLPEITGVTIKDGDGWLTLNEGKWISGRFPDNIRIDQPTHLAGQGQIHGHVHDRKGREIVAVNLDGTSSHGRKGRLHPDDAAALEKRGFQIPKDRIIEFWVIGQGQVLFG
ncbi:hypothetical protein [uncultured Caulobacter sp.]|uniref:hypothetical protein n=1 Tax=uncultured Caulobacter sp. TaxID=158749 RepID=UPI00260D220A|nr:hypothetical protein [uncultured Caulobacter sp.]